MVTIATNMAGRGTDIQLGGNKNLEKIENIKIDKEKVKNLGGLYIVGTERHESRRIDNLKLDLVGKETRVPLYISLEDDLMRIFGAKSIDVAQKIRFETK